MRRALRQSVHLHHHHAAIHRRHLDAIVIVVAAPFHRVPARSALPLTVLISFVYPLRCLLPSSHVEPISAERAACFLPSPFSPRQSILRHSFLASHPLFACAYDTSSCKQLTRTCRCGFFVSVSVSLLLLFISHKMQHKKNTHHTNTAYK